MDERNHSAFVRPGKPPPAQVQEDKRHGPTPDIPVVLGRLTARGRLVLVECASGEREAEWLGLIKAAAPRTPLLRITPKGGGAHPTFMVPAGVTRQ